MDISITQTYPKIGIQTVNAKLELKNCGKIDYTISHTDPKLEIYSTLPKVIIDQSRCFADEGLKGIKDFRDEVVQLAQNQVMQYISKKAEEGDSYTKTENGGRPILSAIRQDLFQIVDYNVGLMPTQGPEITAEMGEANVNVVEGDIQTAFNNVPIDSNYTPGKVSYYLLQKGGVSIEYVGKNLDAKV